MAGCGPCNLCCDYMGVEMEPLEEGRKPPFQPCKFMCPARGGEGGCSVYESRPTSCRVFKCLWLYTQGLEPDYRLPKILRPDKTDCVIEVNSHGNLAVHTRGKKWMEKPMYGYLHAMSERTAVIVYGMPSGKVYRLYPDHTLTECFKIGTAENGESLYATRDEPEHHFPVRMAA